MSKIDPRLSLTYADRMMLEGCSKLLLGLLRELPLERAPVVNSYRAWINNLLNKEV